MRQHLSAFYGSLFVSRLADQVLLFLVPLVVFQTTQSAAWSGVAFFIETLPRFLAFPVCGVLCDRIAPLQLLRTSQRWRAAACALGLAVVMALALANPGSLLEVAVLVTVSGVCGVLTTQGVMAREVLLPQVAPSGSFVQSLAHAQIADQLGMVLSPMLAAVCLQFAPWQACLAGTGVLFVAADTLLALWRKHSAAVLTAPSPMRSGDALAPHRLAPYRMAAQHLWKLPGLPRLIALAAGVNLVVGGTLATSAALLMGVHARSASEYAWLQSAGALATVVVLLGIARARWSARTLGPMGFVLMVCGGVLSAFAPSAAGYVAGYLLVTGFDKMFGVALRAERQLLIPAQDFGKTSGLMVLLNNATQPLAGLAVGAWSTSLGAAGVVAVLTAAMAVIGFAVLVRVAANPAHSLTNKDP